MNRAQLFAILVAGLVGLVGIPSAFPEVPGSLGLSSGGNGVAAVSVTPTESGALVTVELAKEDNIDLGILLGESKVSTLHQGVLGPGKHTFIWDGKDDQGAQLPSGTYAVEAKSQDGTGLLYREGFSTTTATPQEGILPQPVGEPVQESDGEEGLLLKHPSL